MAGEEHHWERLGRDVRAWRAQRGLNQLHLATAAQFSVATLRKIENGT